MQESSVIRIDAGRLLLLGRRIQCPDSNTTSSKHLNYLACARRQGRAASFGYDTSLKKKSSNTEMMQLSIIGIYCMEGETNAGVVAKEKGRDVERESSQW